MRENKLDRVFGWLTKLRLQVRISLLVTLGLVLLFHFMGWQGARQIDSVIQLTLQERLILARTVARDLDHDLERTLSRLTQVAAFPTINLEDGDMAPEKAELRALYRPQSFSYLFLLDKDGLVLWTEPYLPEVVGRQRLECPQVQEALRVGQPAIACLSHTLTPQAPVVAPVVPIKNKAGAVVGILGAAIDPSSPAFSDLLRSVAPGRTGYTQLVDENGLVLAHTGGQALFRRSEHADLFISLLKEKKATVVTQSVTEEGKATFSEVVAFAPLSQAPWGVAVEQAEAELLAPTLELRNRMILFAAVALAVGLLLIWATTLTVVRPVRRLIAAAGRIAAGDLATPVPPLGEDEIGELGRRFEEMRVRLARWGEELETAVQKRARELSVLYAIDRATAQSLNLDEILNDALDKVLETLKVEAGGIYLVQPDGETMTLRVYRGVSDESVVKDMQRLQPGEGVAGRAAAEKKPVVLDVADYPTERLAPALVRGGFQTLASTPLLSAGKLIGALSMGTRRPRAFPPEELDLLMAIGQQLGSAVANARLYQETRRHLDELSSLQDAAVTVASELELPRVLNSIVEKAASSLDMPFSAIFLLDEASGLLHLRATHGLSERYLREIQPVPLGLGLIGRAAAKRQPMVSEDLENEPKMQHLPHNLQVALEEGIRSVLAVPMLTKGKVVGTLSGYAQTSRVFDPEQIRLLSTFADHAAIAVENARLFQETQERAERLALLNRIAHALSTTINLDELLEIVYREITAVVEADVFFIALLDHAANELDFRIRIDQGVREPAERRPLTTGLTALVVTSQQPVLVRDFEKEKEHLPPVKLWGTMQAPPSWLGVPLRLGDTVVGVISVQAYRPNAYGDAEQVLLSTIADAVAVAIENAQLYEAEQRRAARLTDILQLGIELATLQEESILLNTLVIRTAAVAESATCTVMLVDELTNEAVLAAQTGLPEGTPLGLRVPLTLPIIRRSLETGDPIILSDIDRDAPAMRQVLVHPDIRAFFAYPMLRQGRALGYLTLSSPTPRTPSTAEIAAYQLLAERAAAAIENARLYREITATKNYLENIIASSIDSISTTDVHGILTFWSHGSQRVMGFRAAEVLGQPLWKYYVGGIEEARKVMNLLREKGELRDYETWFWHKDGHKVPVSVSASLLKDEQGNISGTLGVAKDITERKQAEEEIQRLYQQVRASEEEYRTLVENATELIWTLDTAGCFTYLNQQAEQVSGYKLADWVGKSFAPLIPPEDLPRLQQVFRETLAGKTQSYTTRVYRADGDLFYLSVNTAPLYRDGQVVGTISFGRDVTEEERLRGETEQRLAELSTLFEVSAALRGTTTVEEMLPLILDRTIQVMWADAGDIYLLDQTKGDLVCRAASERLKALRSIRLQRGEGITGYVLETGQPYLSPDLFSDAKFSSRPELRAAFQGLHSKLSVPIKTGEAVIGAMHISSLTPRTFTESEVRLLAAIADMAASAIHRASLFEELEHRVHELSALFDVSKMATSTLRIQDLLGSIVGAAAETLHAEGAYLFLWDEREERLVMQATHGLSPDQVGRVKYRLGEGLSGRVFLESRLANVPDVAADPRWKREPDKEATHPSGRVISALVVPLIVGMKTMGVLGVVNKIGAPAFTPSDESFLTALAGQVAIAIENARLYEDVRGLSFITIRSLAAAIDERDPYMRGHSNEVARLAVQLGRELGWSGADLEMLEFAALLHDVGKIAVPDAVLKKVEPLTPDDWNIIRMHPYHSAQIVKPVEPLQRIIPWIYHHHERWDGTGYPDGSKGTAIPLAARILAVVDAFNAIITGRPHRQARSVAEALAEIQRCAGTQFDPAMAEAFLRVVGK